MTYTQRRAQTILAMPPSIERSLLVDRLVRDLAAGDAVADRRRGLLAAAIERLDAELAWLAGHAASAEDDDAMRAVARAAAELGVVAQMATERPLREVRSDEGKAVGR